MGAPEGHIVEQEPFGEFNRDNSCRQFSSINPEGERGFKMVHGHPETPLLLTDGERGFSFFRYPTQ